jgi:hypothetical protein
MGFSVVQAQDEQSGDESHRQPATSRGRTFPGANPPRSSRADQSSASAKDEGQPVDTTHNKRLVVIVSHAPAMPLASAVERHFRGIPGLSLVPVPTSNSILVSAPAEWLDEVRATIAKLDRTPKSAAINVEIVELPPAAAGKVDAHDFHGPSKRIRAKIDELKAKGQVQRVQRFRVTALDNQTTSLQANGEKPTAAPEQPPAAGARPRMTTRVPGTGTTIQATARISDDKSVVAELIVDDSPSPRPANRDEQPPPEGVNSRFLGTLSIPAGTTVVASEIATGDDKPRVIILISADVIEAPPE